jgi:probable rRNA maturation factor
MQVKPKVTVDGSLPKAFASVKSAVKSAAEFFAAKSSARIGVPFRAVTVVLQDDAFSAEVHLAVNGAEGPTDAVTQRYDAIPGEDEGVYGEVYVNCDQALRAASKRRGWSPLKELLLYVAHGMDHLSGADDLQRADYDRMRRRELAWLRELETL